VADGGLNAVVKITPAGAQSTVPFSYSSAPQALALDASGNIYASEGGAAIYTTTQGGAESTFYPAALTNGYYPHVDSIAFSPTGHLYFADNVHGAIFTTPQGGPATVISSAIPGVQSIAFDAAGNLYAASSASGKMGLYELTPTGAVMQLISVSDNALPSSVALDPSGNVYLVNSGNGGAPTGQIVKLDRADAPGVSFPSATNVGTIDITGGTHAVSAINIGNQPLTFTGIAYPNDFSAASGDVNACTTSTLLNPAVACDLPIRFTPNNQARRLTRALFSPITR
jgi:streptogramin lyase